MTGEMSPSSAISSSADLTPENVSAIFLDSLATDDDPPEEVIVAEGIVDDFRFQAERLYSHVLDVEAMLSHSSTAFFENRGGGHVWLDLALRRDGYRWGSREDVDRLLALGMAMNFISYSRAERTQWTLFPGSSPYVSIKGRLFKLWARFQSIQGEALTVPFDAEGYLPPAEVEETSWYGPTEIKVASMGEYPKHVAEAFYQDIVVLGFFEKELPSWILDQDTLLKVY